MITCKVGDIVVRNLCGILMPLKVTDLTDKLIICGGRKEEHIGWWFDRNTGAEIDEELGWNSTRTGSVLIKFADTGYIVSEETAKGLADKIYPRSGG